MVDSFQERKFEERSIRVIVTHVEGSTTHWFSCCLVLRDQDLKVRKDFEYRYLTQIGLSGKAEMLD
jgi:hypothetical protein